MSLLTEAMETCVVLDKRVVDDGYGGYTTEYFPGVEFQAAIVMDNSIEAQEAMSNESVGIYTVTTRKNINLQYHDVFRRVEDGKIFRVTSDGDDRKTPPSASLNMRQVSAQEWELPNE